MKIEDLISLPWTWDGPRQVEEEGAIYWVVEVAELEGFVVAGDTLEEVERDRIDALREFLLSYLEEGTLPPLPGWRLAMPGSTDTTSRPFDFTGVDATVSEPDLLIA